MLGIEDRGDILWIDFRNMDIWDEGKEKFKWDELVPWKGLVFSFIGKRVLIGNKKEVSSVIMEIRVFSDLGNCRQVVGWIHARWGLGIILQLCLFVNHYHSHWLGFKRLFFCH